MSQDMPTSKKRRLESEQSQNSGITLLSNITQSTDLPSDFDDSSDTSSGNVNLHSATNVTDDPGTRNTRNIAPRKRQVSWSLEYDDDETFVKGCRVNEATSPVSPTVPYDNNFNGTNNSRHRVRRLTEGSIDTRGFSCYQARPLLKSPCGQNNQRASKMRSNTTSQIHGHENDIQRQRIMEELIRQHDAQAMHNRRSQSVTSLRDQSLHTGRGFGEAQFRPVTPQYEPLQHVTRPVDTVVTIPNGGPNYLHPITQIHNIRTERNSDSSQTCDSGYADVHNCDKISRSSQHKVVSCHSCNSTFFRKGFFVLLVLNVVFILLNVVGIPYVFVAMKRDIADEAPVVAASDMCNECGNLSAEFREFYIASGSRCCFSPEKFSQTLNKTKERLIDAVKRIRDKPAAKVPVLQLKASKEKDERDYKIVWSQREDINTMRAQIVDRKWIVVPKNGYYYIYSRIHYENTNAKESEGFTVGHEVMKQTTEDDNPTLIDSVVQKCFPSKTTGDVRHTNHIGSVQFLKEGDKLFVQLDQRKHFDPTNSLFGMFLVAT